LSLFSFLKKKDFFPEDEKQRIVAAIRATEQQTSGEIRVYVESKCRFVDPLDRAAEVFWGLKMDHTEDRNAVLVYVAMRDHQYAVFADEGIFKKVGQEFWKEKVSAMNDRFQQGQVADAIIQVVGDIGNALHQHFPYDRSTDRNELPDDIVFGA
jgi:uncharacterized membrane protein